MRAPMSDGADLRPITRYDLIKMLKENLSLSIEVADKGFHKDTDEFWIKATLKLGDEIISESEDLLP